MEEHWESGYDNACRTLVEPEVMRLPDPIEGVLLMFAKTIPNRVDGKA
jgi:hypothetical protein